MDDTQNDWGGEDEPSDAKRFRVRNYFYTITHFFIFTTSATLFSAAQLVLDLSLIIYVL